MDLCLRRAPLLAALAVLLALVAPARADTLKVPQQHPTLQAAVDAAAPGDVITVAAGRYVENVLVPEGLDGLVLQGQGQVFLDAYTAGDGVVVRSSGVTVRDLTIRHAAQRGVVAQAVAEGGELVGFTLEGVTVLGSAAEGIVLVAQGAELDRVVVTGCDGVTVIGASASITRTQVLKSGIRGLVVWGDGATIERCTIDKIGAGGTGLQVVGNDATIRHCRVSDAGDLVQVFGSRAVIERNRLHHGSVAGLTVDGDAALIEGNLIDHVAGGLLELVGADAVVRRNRLSSGHSVGLRVVGTAPTVSYNVVERAGMFGGIIVVTPGAATIERNRVADTRGGGFVVEMDGGLLSRNQALSCGRQGVGFVVSGDGNTLERNVASHGALDGFLLVGVDNTATGNRALGNVRNGFLVGQFSGAEGGPLAIDTVLRDNVALGNGGQGLLNAGVATVLSGSLLRHNLLDLANTTSDGASLVDGGGNQFETGGFEQEPVLPGG